MRHLKRILAVLLVIMMTLGCWTAPMQAASIHETEKSVPGTGIQSEPETKQESGTTISGNVQSAFSETGSTESETKQTESETKSTESEKPTEPETKEPETKATESETPTEPETKEPETKEPETSEPDKVRPYAEVSTADQLLKTENFTKLGFTDTNFINAIIDSIKNYKNHTWLAKRSETTLEELLGAYSGGIQGNAYIEDENGDIGYKEDQDRIKDISGIYYLKAVTTDWTALNELSVDLRGNMISNLMPIFDICMDRSDWYYGIQINGRTKIVHYDFRDNPIRCIPDKQYSAGNISSVIRRKSGLMTFQQMTQYMIMEGEETIRKYYFLREDNEDFAGTMEVGCVHLEKPDSNDYAEITDVTLTERIRDDQNNTEYDGASTSDSLASHKTQGASNTPSEDETEPGAQKDILDIKENGLSLDLDDGSSFKVAQSDSNPNRDFVYSGLTRSGNYRMTILLDDCLFTYAQPPQGEPIHNKTSMEYQIFPEFSVFDRVRLSVENEKVAICLRKGDAINQDLALAGAVYALYKKVDGGEDEHIGDYTTNAEGYTETILVEPGEYYFREVEAPPGYELDTKTTYKLVVGTDGVINGGVNELHYVSADGSKLDAQAETNERFVSYAEKTPNVSFALQPKEGSDEEVDVEYNEGAIEKVTVQYQSLYDPKNPGAEKDPVTETFNNPSAANAEGTDAESRAMGVKLLADAAKSINEKVKKNLITGAVDVTVTFSEKTASATQTAKAANYPCTKVVVDKGWSGTMREDGWGEVEYTLYRYSAESEPEQVDLSKIAGLDADRQQNPVVKGPSTDIADYQHVFGEDKEGRPKLPTYWLKDGKPVAYTYVVIEKVTDPTGRNEFAIDEENTYKEGPILIQGEKEEDNKNVDNAQREEEVLRDKAGNVIGRKITIGLSNYRKPSIKIKKLDPGSSARPLAGVEFKLEKKDASGEDLPDAKSADQDSSKREGVGTVITNEEGGAEFYGLTPGTYILTETKAASGYILLKEPIEITVANPDEEHTDSEYVYLITNNRSYDLPKSGGKGLELFLCMGAILFAATALLQIRRRRAAAN